MCWRREECARPANCFHRVAPTHPPRVLAWNRPLPEAFSRSRIKPFYAILAPALRGLFVEPRVLELRQVWMRGCHS
jgi:hypothetical protein